MAITLQTRRPGSGMTLFAHGEGQEASAQAPSAAPRRGACLGSVPPLSNTGINESFGAGVVSMRCLFPVGFLGRCGFAPKKRHKPNGDWVRWEQQLIDGRYYGGFYVLRNSRNVERSA